MTSRCPESFSDDVVMFYLAIKVKSWNVECTVDEKCMLPECGWQ